MDCDLQQQDDLIASDDQFEPMEYTLETQWGDDGGGMQVVQQRKGTAKEPPENPGDTKCCSDFDYYEDALRWFETYQPYYGDVAKLDPDRDGVASVSRITPYSRPGKISNEGSITMKWFFHLSSTLTPGPEHLIATQ
mmetsp:Transcript_7968/g.14490  ORF Transcript_7968/g.14490 Transcript_7968/m.14490 type:complete len:137 (-) Transcript_7968:78-488(-)